jgi:hypothetical protein
MNGRERVTRAVEFRGPDRIPVRIGPSALMWKTYRQRLRAILTRVGPPVDFGYAKEPYPSSESDFDGIKGVEREGDDFVDAWGVTWHNAQEGIVGIPRVHPLADWKALDRLKVPDPLAVDEWGQPMDWSGIERAIAETDHQRYVRVDGDRLWERMWFLRGMEPLMMDVAEGRPEVQQLIDVIVEHHLKLLDRWLTLDIDGVQFGDDWGTQDRLLISPKLWRRYFKPAYARLFERVKRAGKHAWLHSDGHILPIIPDLVEIGLDVVNPQLSANGAANVARLCKGRICVEADLDRQHVIPFGTPDEVRAHVREAIAEIASDDGGMTIIAYAYPLAPLENVEALCEAFRDYCPYPLRV